jgi:hypothetical protein
MFRSDQQLHQIRLLANTKASTTNQRSFSMTKGFVIILAALALTACNKASDALSDLAPAVGNNPQASEFSTEPLKGKINDKEWTAGSGIAQIVHYSDGTDLLKITIGTQTFTGCTPPTEFGWTGAVIMFAPLKTGTFTGMDATVQFDKGATDGVEYVQDNKAIRIDSIDSQKVVGAISALKETNNVNGTFTAQLCPF